ncbi:LOW QUALITY PROTEIN: hypothetical protein V2J09_018300 [Rumex salicifolius]
MLYLNCMMSCHLISPLGRLLEFHAIIRRNEFQMNVDGEDLTFELSMAQDLSLDFTLPGYPAMFLSAVMVGNLKEYVSLVLDATLHTGIFRQVEAFKSGFNKMFLLHSQVFPISQLQIFNEDKLERLLCGERDSWSTEMLDHCKIDHGYTASSTPILYASFQIISLQSHIFSHNFTRLRSYKNSATNRDEHFCRWWTRRPGSQIDHCS